MMHRRKTAKTLAPRIARTRSFFTPKWIEFIGLCILLAAFSWQELEGSVKEISSGEDTFIINQKLDKIWLISTYQFALAHPDLKKIPDYVNVEYLDSSWIDWQKQLDIKKYVDGQVNNSKNIRVILYLLGSIILLFGKFVDAYTDKKPTKSLRITDSN